MKHDIATNPTSERDSLIVEEHSGKPGGHIRKYSFPKSYRLKKHIYM
jgi:hypothetical protein